MLPQGFFFTNCARYLHMYTCYIIKGALIGAGVNHDRPTDWLTDQPTDQWAGGVMGKLDFQQGQLSVGDAIIICCPYQLLVYMYILLRI